MSLLTYQDRQIISNFNNEVTEANHKKKELELMKQSLESTKVAIQKKQKDMSEDLLRKDKLLASVREKRSSYEAMIKELEASSEKLREMIETFEKERPLPPGTGKGFSALKGQLPWPVHGDMLIPFGKYNDPQYNIPVFKNGIEIRADGKDQPTAVYEGNVVYADWFKGDGLLLIINHGSGYHSLYGHLSEIFHKSNAMDTTTTTTDRGMMSMLSRLLNKPDGIRLRIAYADSLRELAHKFGYHEIVCRIKLSDNHSMDEAECLCHNIFNSAMGMRDVEFRMDSVIAKPPEFAIGRVGDTRYIVIETRRDVILLGLDSAMCSHEESEEDPSLLPERVWIVRVF